ncbi:hypothetical protein RDI58_003677 [Solanum bulbocastanum]|uniref:Uncharacterized protein n=1 Tax=Solanum bulbocastanum TaxID=147425 RepID=A0AAN8YSC4_SOLBU
MSPLNEEAGYLLYWTGLRMRMKIRIHHRDLPMMDHLKAMMMGTGRVMTLMMKALFMLNSFLVRSKLHRLWTRQKMCCIMGEGVSSACEEHLYLVLNCLASLFSCFLYNSCLMNELSKSIYLAFPAQVWPCLFISTYVSLLAGFIYFWEEIKRKG